MSALAATRRWVRDDTHPVARLARRGYRALRGFEVPVLPGVHAGLYALHIGVRQGLGWLARVLWWTPLFKSRLAGPAPRLYLYSGMPQVLGPLTIHIGARCRISGVSTFSGRAAGPGRPCLHIGDNVGIGWQTTIAVGRRVVLGNNVRIAGRGFLAGYPGHPLDPVDRAAGLADTEDQIGDIVLHDDVWLGSGVSVLAGVEIGRGTIVAAGSVVTHDLPEGVLAAGVPARIVRSLAARRR